MKADKLTVNSLFDPTERRDAPLFQRPYVWKQEENWEPLSESMIALARKRLASDLHVRPHFLGAVVLDQVRTPTGKLSSREIIDGQQRLTTLQLALAAARDVCLEFGQAKYSEAFKKLTCNDVPLSEDSDDLFKVWPTNADRAEFRKVMTAGSSENARNLDLSRDCLIRNAYLFFADEFRSWIREDESGESAIKRIQALYTAIRTDLNLVVIDLDHDDDAQEIFETLNALGTPLLPADLVKNYLFRLADSLHEDTDKLYARYWQNFDAEKSYWRQEVRQGRLKRARLDLFLNQYLTLMTGSEILISQMFLVYRDFVENSNGTRPSQHLEQFRSYADVYQSFDEFPPDSPEALFFYRLEQMDTTVVYPLLLEVFKRYATPDKQRQLRDVLLDLESYLVRRTVCDLTVKGYNRFFTEVVKRLRRDGDFSPSAIRSVLVSEKADTSRWPDDKEFEDAWQTVPFYRRVKKSKQRMILEALEASLHSEKTEKVKIERKLTVEHLLPVEWERHWPLVVREDTPEAQADALKNRNNVLHRIGNLTLLTKVLNPSVSNGPWTKKREDILKHSALNLNRVFHNVDTWNEARIEQRSKDLLAIAVTIWPHPGS